MTTFSGWRRSTENW